MPSTKSPIRFSIGIPHQCTTGEEIREFARKAEDLGYFAIQYDDHLPRPLAPLMTLLHAAEATSRIRLATLVLNNDLRHPAVLAKEAATLDHLSDGRFIFGIGAGITKSEYEETGIAYDKPSIRIARLAESVQVIKGLFREGPFSFDGVHYQISDMDGSPKPTQRPHPPIMIGGGSKPLLELAGREADMISITASRTPSGLLDFDDVLAGHLEPKLEWVRAAAGSRIDDIEITGLLSKVIVTDDAKAAARNAVESFRAARSSTGQRSFDVRDDFDPESLFESPRFAIGSAKQCADHFRELRDRFGMSIFTASHNELDDIAPVIAELGDLSVSFALHGASESVTRR